MKTPSISFGFLNYLLILWTESFIMYKICCQREFLIISKDFLRFGQGCSPILYPPGLRIIILKGILIETAIKRASTRMEHAKLAFAGNSQNIYHLFI